MRGVGGREGGSAVTRGGRGCCEEAEWWVVGISRAWKLVPWCWGRTKDEKLQGVVATGWWVELRGGGVLWPGGAGLG